jgi:hypothetical protein
MNAERNGICADMHDADLERSVILCVLSYRDLAVSYNFDY